MSHQGPTVLSLSSDMDVSLSKDQLLKATLTEDGGGTNAKRDADEPAAMLEPGTLQWLEDRETGTGERTVGVSARSDASSWTESERGRRMERAELIGEGRDHLEENRLPEKAAQVFSPAVTVLPSLAASRDTEAFWEMESERSPFLSPCQVDYNQHGYQFDFPEDTPPSTCEFTCDCCSRWAVLSPHLSVSPACPGKGGCSDRDALKLGVSVMTSALLFPFLVWGGYVFLPFDAPLLVGAPLRLVYTLRCSVFAAAPVVLGETERRDLPVCLSPVLPVALSAPQVGWSWVSAGSAPDPLSRSLMMSSRRRSFRKSLSTDASSLTPPPSS